MPPGRMRRGLRIAIGAMPSGLPASIVHRKAPCIVERAATNDASRTRTLVDDLLGRLRRLNDATLIGERAATRARIEADRGDRHVGVESVY
jgi:hypothetical protein